MQPDKARNPLLSSHRTKLIAKMQVSKNQDSSFMNSPERRPIALPETVLAPLASNQDFAKK